MNARGIPTAVWQVHAMLLLLGDYPGRGPCWGVPWAGPPAGGTPGGAHHAGGYPGWAAPAKGGTLGGVPCRGYPGWSLPARGCPRWVPSCLDLGMEYPPPGPEKGYPHLDLGRGYPPAWTWEGGTPWTWDGVPPSRQLDGVPAPPRCELTDKLKI